MKKIEEFVNEAFRSSQKRGFHDQPVEFGTSIALVHTEVTEVLTAETDQNRAEEFADIIIRILDICGDLDIPLHKAFLEQTGLAGFSENIEKIQNSVEGKEDIQSICLNLHTLLTKSMEEYRYNIPWAKKAEKISEHLYEVFAYIFKSCKSYEYDIETAVINKMQKNKNRPYKHNKIV